VPERAGGRREKGGRMAADKGVTRADEIREWTVAKGGWRAGERRGEAGRSS